MGFYVRRLKIFILCLINTIMSDYPRDILADAKEECERRRYSQRTTDAYILAISKFLQFSGKSTDKIGKKDALDYLNYLSSRGLAGSSLNLNLSAVKFLLESVLRKNINLNLRYSRIRKKLPSVLSRDEVNKLIKNTRNSKHKIIVSLIYGSGLRVSELINLRIKDFDFKNKIGRVISGKGGKDRLFIIPEKLFRVLLQMSVARNREEYFFLTNRNDRYSMRGIQEIIKESAKISGLTGVHPHTLRHSFATHLIEQGQSISEVQMLLGHSSPETTQVYLHTSTNKMLDIKSPLDEI